MTDKWLSLGDDDTPQALTQLDVSWQATLPPELDPDRLMINPVRLRRYARIGGLGGAAIYGADLSESASVAARVNPDGTMSMLSVQSKARTNRGGIDGDPIDENIAWGSAFYRPTARIELDTRHMRNSLASRGKDGNPFAWSRLIDRSVKDALIQSSLQANIADSVRTPLSEDMERAIRLPIRAIFVSFKGLAAYIGVKNAGDFLVGQDTAVDFLGNLAFKNLIDGALWGGLTRLHGGEVSLKTFKGSLITPWFSIDRPIYAGMVKGLGGQVIKYAH